MLTKMARICCSCRQTEGLRDGDDDDGQSGTLGRAHHGCVLRVVGTGIRYHRTPPEFQIIESCDPGTDCAGTFTVINNSTDLYVYGFQVGNPVATSAGTTQPNWAAFTCTSGNSCTGLSEDEFEYTANNPYDLTDDVGPNSSSSKFTFSALTGSPAILDLVDANGVGSTFDLETTLQTSEVPEPMSAALFGSGLLALAGIVGRRRGGD